MVQTIELEPRQEFIFKIGDEPIKIELRRGSAEVYGNEMLANKTYTFQRYSKAAVFTYQGATLEMNGSPMKSHLSKNCDYMMRYLAIHRDLERMRDEAEKISQHIDFRPTTISNSGTNVANDNNLTPLVAPQPTETLTAPPTTEITPQIGMKPDLSKTPICFVCEPMDAKNVGKSTLCRILLNYAARRGRAPIFVDLDPDQGHIGLPGTIGALSIESPIDIESGLELRSSMLMHFGHTSPSADSESKSSLYYTALVENMAKIVHSRLEQDRKSFYSGVIINSSSWTDNNEYQILVDACKNFNANMVIVVDDEVLQDDLQKDLAKQNPVVLNVPKTVEIHKSRATEHVELRYAKIKEYFYGTEHESYNPMTSEVKFSTFLKNRIYKIGSTLMLPDSLMPLGRKVQDNQVKVSKYECTASDLLHHILAISYCKLSDVEENPECVIRTNIMGFICVTNVRSDGEIVSIMTPQKCPPDHVLLYSDIQYMDSLI